MGLKAIKGIRQYVDFDDAGKARKMFEITFTTEKARGEFTLDTPVEGYTADKAKQLAAARAEEIDKAIS